MSWIGTAAQQARKSEPAEPLSSLEYATTVASRGTAPANAVVEHLTAHECRLRSVVFFDVGEMVEFDFVSPDRVTIHARGHVADRKSKGPRFIYRVRLDRMHGHEVDELARAVAMSYRFRANERAHQRAISKLPTTDGLVRASHRVIAHFPVQYRTARESIKPGRADDVSSGGLSMTCADALVPGEIVELTFTLPSDVLDVHPEQTAILDLRTRSVSHVRGDLRRPFEEFTLRARIVSHAPLGGGSYKYGVSFLEIDALTSEELARYVHAVQLNKSRYKA